MEQIKASQRFGMYILRNYTEILDDDDLVEDLISVASGDIQKVLIMISEYIKVSKN